MKKQRTKKYFGQHFLRDEIIIQKIVEAIHSNCDPQQALLEIGPGEGVLTKHLYKLYPEFKAIEIDNDLIHELNLFLKPNQLINEDFLKLDLNEIYSDAFNVVGNFPYNISSQIIFKVLDNVERVPNLLGMFQKEVALRICSDPGSKSNGIISILTQLYYDCEVLLEIPPTVFYPPPKVDSAIICLRRKVNPPLPEDYKLFKQVVKMGFQQRRKKLRNTLKPLVGPLEIEIFDKRPEQLGVEEFINIANLIKAKKNES